VVVGDINTPLSPGNRSSNKNINKEILELNDTIDQMNLTDVYRIFHTTRAHTFFSAVHGTFSKIDNILGHKGSPCSLSDHNAVKLELNNKNNSRKYTNNWRLNNTFLKDQWVKGEIKEEIKSFLEINENENITYQNLWDIAKAVLKE
jgi:hypothetical protein